MFRERRLPFKAPGISLPTDPHYILPEPPSVGGVAFEHHPPRVIDVCGGQHRIKPGTLRVGGDHPRHGAIVTPQTLKFRLAYGELATDGSRDRSPAVSASDATASCPPIRCERGRTSPVGLPSRCLLPVALHQAAADPGEDRSCRLVEPHRLAGADGFPVPREQRLARVRVGVPQAT